MDFAATLREVFEGVPDTVGFNIEFKYPNDFIVQNEKMKPVERNAWVDRILDDIFLCAKERKVMFSSFDSDICRLLQRKQNRYPTFFLTHGGYEPFFDFRGRCLRDAIRFARSARLPGIVCFSDIVMSAPTTAQAPGRYSLLFFTYGDANNNVENCQLQKKVGVNSVIVDHVAWVSANIETEL